MNNNLPMNINFNELPAPANNVNNNFENLLTDFQHLLMDLDSMLVNINDLELRREYMEICYTQLYAIFYEFQAAGGVGNFTDDVDMLPENIRETLNNLRNLLHANDIVFNDHNEEWIAVFTQHHDVAREFYEVPIEHVVPIEPVIPMQNGGKRKSSKKTRKTYKHRKTMRHSRKARKSSRKYRK